MIPVTAMKFLMFCLKKIKVSPQQVQATLCFCLRVYLLQMWPVCFESELMYNRRKTQL